MAAKKKATSKKTTTKKVTRNKPKMRQFKFTGDPRDGKTVVTWGTVGSKQNPSLKGEVVMDNFDASNPKSINIAGYDFELDGDPVKVNNEVAEKLAANPHFQEVK